MILADWYDPGVGGHGMGDWTRGRIYRVTPKGHKGYKVPAVALETEKGWLEAMGSPCLATRAFALNKLNAMDHIQKVHFLKAGMASSDNRLALLCFWHICLLNIDTPVEKWPGELTRAFYNFYNKAESDHNLAANFARIMEDTFRDDANTHAKISSRPIAVLREELLGMRHINPESINTIFYLYARCYDGHDDFYRAALNIACGTDPKRRDIILADFDTYFPEWNDKVADLVWELRPKSVLPRLATLLSDNKLTAAQKARILDLLATSEDIEAGKTTLSLLKAGVPAEIQTRAIENLKMFLPNKWKPLSQGEDLAKAAESLLKSEEGKRSGLQLIAATGQARFIGEVQAIAGDAKASESVRIEAVRTLGQIHDLKAVEALVSLLPGQGPVAVAAITALGEQIPRKADSPAAKKALAALESVVSIINKGGTLDVQRAALTTLVGTYPGSEWLIELQEKKQLSAELAADAGRLLRNSPFQALRNKAALLFPRRARSIRRSFRRLLNW